jgi:hypothetical protein
VFQHFGSADGARKRLVSELALKMDEIDQICKLSDSQRRKLSLAGRGDMNRFFDEVEQAERKFQTLDGRQNANAIFQELMPLQIRFQSGLFDSGSLLHKSMRHVLTDPQREAYKRALLERRRLRHQAAVELTVKVLEQRIPLSANQREALIEMLLKDTKPPRMSGQHDCDSILYQASFFPPARFQPLLDKTQWKVIHRQLTRARAREEWLKKQGGLPAEDDDDDWL